MEQIELLRQRLERAKAALRAEKRRQRERDQARAFDLVRRSGLTVGELENLLANRSAPVPGPAADDFESGGQA